MLCTALYFLELLWWPSYFFYRLQEEIHQKEEAENNLSAFRAVCYFHVFLENL